MARAGNEAIVTKGHGGTNTFINPNQMSCHKLLARRPARSLYLLQSHNLFRSRLLSSNLK